MENNFAEAIDRIAELAQKAAQLDAVKQVFDLPSGQKLVLLNDGTADTIGEASRDDYGIQKAAPARIAGKYLIQTADSMVEYLERFKGKGTTLFANITTNRIVGVIDFHIDGETPGFGQHYAVLDLPFSEEWKTWQAAHNKMTDQKVFARYIEENSADIVAPSGADILQCCRDLHAVRKADFTRAVRTNTDTESFEYSESTELKSRDGNVEVPTKFKLEMPVYFGGQITGLFSFLRWNLDDGKLELGIALHRAEHVRQAVFKQIVQDIADRASVPVVYGSSTASLSL